MIQRIQTLYLVLGIAALLGAVFIGLAPVEDSRPDFLLPVIGLVLAAAVALAAVFLYGRRPVQRSWVLAAQVVTLLTVAGLFFLQFTAGTLPGIHASSVVAWIDALLPVAAYGFFWLGRRAIDRDIALVRSMDRLR